MPAQGARLHDRPRGLGAHPGYRLKQQIQITEIPPDQPVHTLAADGGPAPTHQVSVFLEVEGAAHYLPANAGNLDIMTSAALRYAESIAATVTAAPADQGATR